MKSEYLRVLDDAIALVGLVRVNQADACKASGNVERFEKVIHPRLAMTQDTLSQIREWIAENEENTEGV